MIRRRTAVNATAGARVSEETHLEQVDEVKHVYRISTRGVYLTYMLGTAISLIWIIHPFWLKNVDSAIATNLGLTVLLLLVIYLNHVLKQYFPVVRNKLAIWVFAFTLPALSVLTLMVEVIYFDLKLSWIAVVIELAIIYGYLGLSFYNFRKIPN